MKKKKALHGKKGKREHRFDCKVNNDLFRRANVARAAAGLTWPAVVEAAMENLLGREA